MPDLYIAYLGGPTLPGRLGEDHEAVLVVADDKKTASRNARMKWRGHGRGHIDSLELVSEIDGHRIRLERSEIEDQYAVAAGPGDGDS